MINKLSKYVDWFIHLSIKENPEKHEKAKMLVLLIFSFLIILSVYASFFIFNGVILDIKAFYNYLGLVAMCVSLYFIKVKGSINTVLQIMSFVGIGMITASIYLGGGIYSHDLYWYLILSVSGMIFISLSSGLVLLVVSIFIVIGFYLLEVYHIKAFNVNNVSLSLEYKLINLIFMFSILSTMMYILVKGNIKLQQVIKEQEEKKQREETAREFHDKIGNKLASISHLAKLVKLKKTDAEKQNVLDQITASSNDLYDNFRDFLWAKDPKSDFSNELFMYLRDYLDDYLKHSNIKLYIETEPNILPEIKLPTTYIREILPIVKESITNIIKHAQAKTIWFSFQITQNQLKIMVMDDGIGKIEDLNKSGNGLKNMLHRAHKIDSQFEISQNKPKGIVCTLICKLPE